MKLHRLVLEWAGAGVVGRAVTVLHFDGTEDAAPPVAAVKAAFEAGKLLFPGGMTITVPNAGDSIDDTDGTLDGVWSSTGGGVVNASGSVGTAAGVGVCIGWSTGAIVSGSKGPRKLRGRTFLVPIARQYFDSDGTLMTEGMVLAQGIANSLQASGGLAVWHRPTTPGGINGTSGAVLSNKVRDRVAYLSSRRD